MHMYYVCIMRIHIHYIYIYMFNVQLQALELSQFLNTAVLDLRFQWCPLVECAGLVPGATPSTLFAL